MSEPMFPSAGQAPAAPAVADAVESDGNRKALVAIGGIGAALVVGAGAFFLLNSGSADPVATPLPVASSGGQVAPAPAASASPSTKPAVRPASSSVTSRDPFKPLFVTVVADTATTSGGSTSGSTSGTTTGSTGSTAPVPAPAPAAPQVVLAVSGLDPAAQTATVSVDGKSYAAEVNKTFGKYYALYNVFNSKCAGVLYGDQSVVVCTGKPVDVSP